MIDAEIKNHGDKIRPAEKPKKKRESTPVDEEDYGDESGNDGPHIIRESDPDPMGLLDN